MSGVQRLPSINPRRAARLQRCLSSVFGNLPAGGGPLTKTAAATATPTTEPIRTKLCIIGSGWVGGWVGAGITHAAHY